MNVDESGRKWSKVDESGRKRTKVDESGQKWTKVDENGRNWTKVDESGRKWTKVDESGLKWTEVDESGQSGRKWTKEALPDKWGVGVESNVSDSFSTFMHHTDLSWRDSTPCRRWGSQIWWFTGSGASQ